MWTCICGSDDTYFWFDLIRFIWMLRLSFCTSNRTFSLWNRIVCKDLLHWNRIDTQVTWCPGSPMPFVWLFFLFFSKLLSLKGFYRLFDRFRFFMHTIAVNRTSLHTILAHTFKYIDREMTKIDVPCDKYCPLNFACCFVAGLWGIGAFWDAGFVHAELERGAAERRVLWRRARRGGPLVYGGRVRYVFPRLSEGVSVAGVFGRPVQLRKRIYSRYRWEYFFCQAPRRRER